VNSAPAGHAAKTPALVRAPHRHGDAAGRPTLPERRLFSAGDRVGLLPFGPHAAATAAPLATAVAGVAAGATAAGVVRTDPSRSTDTREAAHRGEPAGPPDAGRDNRRIPDPPPGTPGNAGAGGVASSAGGAASSVWCAILLAGFLLFSPQLRRHCARLVIPAPRGVELLLHRPG
jgi:hypothetical protein